MSHWSAIWMVALREMRERFRGRAFKISTVIAAAVVAGIIIVPNLNKDEDTVYDVGLVNVTNPVVKQAVNAVGPAIGATLRIHDVASVAEATRQVRLKTLDIALVEGNRIIVSEKADPGRISKKLRLQLGISEASRLPTALTAEGLSPEQVARALTRPPLEVDALSRPKVANESVATGIIGVIALFIFLQQYGGWILVGVAEEKSSRIAEVLLAAVRPRELVAGKIVGIGIIGLAQASTVAATAVIASRVVGSDALAGTSAFYALGAVGWFVLGFLFYGWAFAAAGSLVSRQSEAQSAAFPIFIPMFAGYLAATTSFGTTDPNAIVRFLAYFPPTAPLCMPVLMADGVVAGWQIALAAGGVVLSVLLIARVAGAVYANSILRTGKRVKWMEALRSA